MKNILVTGANGFVGQHLCTYLTDLGYNVTAATRSQEVQNIKTVQVGNIDAETDWSKALKNIDIVIHLAARVHIMQDTDHNPLETYRKINVQGTKNLAEQAAQHDVKRLVFLSSIKVNGEKTLSGEPFLFNSIPQPQDPYSLSKWEAEQSLLNISKKTDLEITILRPPLVYGPGVKANFMKLIWLSQKGLPVPFGCLKNKRSLIYVNNLCDGLHQCAIHENAAGKTFLISDQNDLSVCDLYVNLCKVNNIKPRLLYIPKSLLRFLGSVIKRQAQIDRLCDSLELNTEQLTKELQWQAPFSVKEALSKTVKSYIEKC